MNVITQEIEYNSDGEDNVSPLAQTEKVTDKAKLLSF